MILTKKYLNELEQKGLFRNIQLNENVYKGDSFDVFVSYSFNDIDYAKKIVKLLIACGFKVYVDFRDKGLNRNNVSRNTALRLAKYMRKCRGLLYIHSKASSVSKWCPWELGYFSGHNNFRCASLPLKDSESDKFPSQEYLEIYPYIKYGKSTKGNFHFWVHEHDNKKYIDLVEWLNGKDPFIHK